MWGGTDKTALIKLERAQRGVLKVMTSKPRLHSTSLLYKECNVLTVRQLFVLKIILRVHVTGTRHPSLENRRRKDRVIVTNPYRTDFSRKHTQYIGPYLYNKISKQFTINNLNLFKCKNILKAFLGNLSYDETEALLYIPQ